jgi:hypothetical protein
VGKAALRMPCHAMPCHATVLRTGFQDRCEARDAGGFQRQLAALSNQATRPLWLLQGPLCELMCVLPLPARTQGSAPCPTSRRASNTDYISLTHKHMPKHTTKIARRAHLGVQGSTLFLNGLRISVRWAPATLQPAKLSPSTSQTSGKWPWRTRTGKS